MTKDEARALVREKVDELKAARANREEMRSGHFPLKSANDDVEAKRAALEQAVNDMLEVEE